MSKKVTALTIGVIILAGGIFALPFILEGLEPNEPDPIIDFDNPTVIIFGLEDGRGYYGRTQTVEIVASDPTTDIDSVWYNWNGNNVSYTSIAEIEFDLGYNTLTAWANDSAGNFASDSITFLITSGNFFSSVWNTSNISAGSSAENQVKLPLMYFGNYLFIVDWGDGSNDTIEIAEYTQPEVIHTYGTPGVYTINITGNIVGWKFDLSSDYLKLLEIKHWGDLQFVDGGEYFLECQNLIITADDIPNLTGITSMYRAFYE